MLDFCILFVVLFFCFFFANVYYAVDAFADGQYKQIDGVILRSGQGEHIASNGTVYKGEWDHDKMNGNGMGSLHLLKIGHFIVKVECKIIDFYASWDHMGEGAKTIHQKTWKLDSVLNLKSPCNPTTNAFKFYCRMAHWLTNFKEKMLGTED